MSTPIDTLALLGVAQHAADHGLTVDSIAAPVVYRDAIVVHVRAVHLEAWLATVHQTDVPDLHPIKDTGHVSIRYPVLVPSAIGDVRTLLITMKPVDELVKLLGPITGVAS